MSLLRVDLVRPGFISLGLQGCWLHGKPTKEIVVGVGDLQFAAVLNQKKRRIRELEQQVSAKEGCLE